MMLTRSRYSRWATVPVLALLLAGCFTSLPQDTSSPGATLPGESPTSALPTIAPTDTPLATGSPTDTLPPTAPPTDIPTDNPHPNWPPGAIGGGMTDEHVGEQATVCGTVDSANWLFDEPGHPTWLNFNHPYPNMHFNAVIWGEQRRAWPESGKPEVVYLDKQICVTGLIEAYSTWYQIQDLAITDIQVVGP